MPDEVAVTGPVWSQRASRIKVGIGIELQPWVGVKAAHQVCLSVQKAAQRMLKL